MLVMLYIKLRLGLDYYISPYRLIGLTLILITNYTHLRYLHARITIGKEKKEKWNREKLASANEHFLRSSKITPLTI